MKLFTRKLSYTFKKNDTVILFMSDSALKGKSGLLPGEFSYISDSIDLDYFKASLQEIIFLPFADRPNMLICGLGKLDELTIDSLRLCGASVTAMCWDKELKNINVFIPEIESLLEKDVLRAIVEGLALSNYSFDRYKSKENPDRKNLVDKATIFTNLKNAADIVTEIENTAANTCLCRDLVNEISEFASADGIVNEAKKIAKSNKMNIKVYSRDDIEKMNMGLFLAVNKGSKIPAQMIVMRYMGNPQSEKILALVGKGLTFDSGGMNLKSSGHIETMRMDMAGAAAVLYTMKNASELKLEKNIVAVIPLTENMLSNDSYRPGDIFKSYNGKTVEIGNTDAEGRLILADALAYTSDVVKPDVIIDIATLTGACIMTFGETVAGFLSNNDDLAGLLMTASENSGEKIWRLPLYKEYQDTLKSESADLNNISSEKNAGTITGATFLNNFIGNERWAHIDIAGTAWYSKKRGYVPKNATGFGVRLLTEFVKNWKDR